MFGKKRGRKPAAKAPKPEPEEETFEEDEFPEDDTEILDSDSVDDSEPEEYAPEPAKKAPGRPQRPQLQPQKALPEMDPAIERTLKAYNESFGRLTTPHITDTLLLNILHEQKEGNKLLRKLLALNE